MKKALIFNPALILPQEEQGLNIYEKYCYNNDKDNSSWDWQYFYCTKTSKRR
jgi:hypothetical protein